MSHDVRKRTFGHVRPKKAQISLHIRKSGQNLCCPHEKKKKKKKKKKNVSLAIKNVRTPSYQNLGSAHMFRGKISHVVANIMANTIDSRYLDLEYLQ